MSKLTPYAKALVAVIVGALGQLVAAGTLSGSALTIAQVLVAALSALLVYLVPNAPAPGG